MLIHDIRDILSSLGNYTFSLQNPSSDIKTLLTDSRNYFIPEETLFFAIKTKGGNDGHLFIKELYDRGVRNFVAEYVPENFPESDDVNFILTDDVVGTLTRIGRLNRHRSKEIVAIAGSRGKTTLKEMIFQLLEPFKRISRSPRSYNSKIGVPLSLWQISPDSDIALIEAGISRKGEMKNLADAINPDTVIFTNIGEAHAAGFSDILEKANEKAIIAGGSNVKTIIYPLDDELLRDSLKDIVVKRNHISWSTKNRDADLYIEPSDSILTYRWEGEIFSIPVKIEKEYDLGNIAGALAYMLKEGISHENIKRQFEKLTRINTRLNVSEGFNGCSVILDSYTSDLSSLIPAIDFANRRKMPGQTLTLISSDLHYEGASPNETYKEMSSLIKDMGVSNFIGIGANLKHYSHLFPDSSKFYLTTEEFLKKHSSSSFSDELILLKGSPEFNFDRILHQLEARKHETVLEVNLDALLRNYNYFRGKLPSSTGIIAMVKASGYGAGSYEIAKTLQDAGAAYLAVAALDEGIDLRKNGIRMPIMIMNPKASDYRALFNYNLEPVIYTMSMLEHMANEAGRYATEQYPVHIKLDTGMHRMGFLPDELDKLSGLLSKNGNIKVASIFSHLATADCLDMDEFTRIQLSRFEKMSSSLIKELGYPVRRHILNSAGILRFPEYHYDYVRLGIGLYGANTLPPEIETPLSVVSTLRTVIICIREIEETETVGYGRKGKIKRKTKIATLPIGYADGMNRHFGNGALNVLVNGEKAPTIGNICMDATMIDVTGIDCNEGDSVEIFGENQNVQTLADILNTIPYEILTSVSPRVKRVYYRE